MIRCDHRFILFSITQTTTRLSMSVRYKSYYGEAEYSGMYGEYTITPLGNYDVPTGWPMKPYKRPYGGTPGPPVMYEKPSDPEDEGAGYGYSNGMSQQERDVFYYHSDHLGSTSYITDRDGNATQFVSYKPYGEALVDEHNTSYEQPWKFNGKELDSETGLYYYGARYYEPVLAMWYGVDALAEKYPNMGGYVYCVGNPVKFVDPDGNEGVVVSGQHGGTMKNRVHFLVNGLDRAIKAKKHIHSKQENVTWIIYSESNQDYGYTKAELSKYKELAKKEGIKVKVVDDANSIVDYINNKNGDDTREKDKISCFYYVGHATPGDLNVGYNGGLIFDGDEFDADQLNSEAFDKGARVNVTAACRTAIDDVFEDSIVDQFAKKLDKKSTIYGSNVRTYFGGGVRTDAQLLDANKGTQIVKHGERD